VVLEWIDMDMKKILPLLMACLMIQFNLKAPPVTSNQFTTNQPGTAVVGDVIFKGNVRLNPGQPGTRTRLYFYDTLGGDPRMSISQDNFTTDPQYRGKLLFYNEDKQRPSMTLSGTNNQSYVDMIFGENTITRKASVNADGSALFATSKIVFGADGSGSVSSGQTYWGSAGNFLTSSSSAASPGTNMGGFVSFDFTNPGFRSTFWAYGINVGYEHPLFPANSLPQQQIMSYVDNAPTWDRMFPNFLNSIIVGSAGGLIPQSGGKVFVGGGIFGRTITSSAVTTNQLNHLIGVTSPIQTQINTLSDRIRLGAGSPEGVVTAPIGTLYVNENGGVNTTLYVKTSGSGNTGWTAK